MKPIKLIVLLENFFNVHLLKQKRVSPHTSASYSETFQLLFEYAKKRLKKPLEQVTLQDLSAQFVSQFLDELEKERKICPKSRNIRLAAIRSFFRTLLYQLPEMSNSISAVLAIPNKRSVSRLIDFLTDDEVDVLLNIPDQSVWVGKRDHALLLIAIQTGMRVSELLELKWKDIHLDQGAYLECQGKGRKERCVPLSVQSNKCLQVWSKEVDALPFNIVFPSIHRKKMSSDAFQYLVNKYAQIAGKKCSSLLEKKVTPHVLRHTAAMRLVRAGVDLSSVALWLGHESIKTTYVYLNANIEMKEKILKKLPPHKTKTVRYKPSDHIMRFLKNYTDMKEDE